MTAAEEYLINRIQQLEEENKRLRATFFLPCVSSPNIIRSKYMVEFDYEKASCVITNIEEVVREGK